MRRVTVFLILFSALIFAQKKDPEVILEKVKQNFNSVQDYVVDVNIKVDVEFIKVPESNAKIYFKQPDKVFVESDKFAMLPKEGLNFSPAAFLQKEYTAVYEKAEKLNGHSVHVIKVIPIGTENDVILTTLWIDENNYAIRKVESATRVGGSFTIDIDYSEKHNKFNLPSKMVFSFNIDKAVSEMPGQNGSPDNGQEKKKKGKESFRTTGKVVIKYSNYQVNRGIPDSVFTEKEKSK